MRTKSSKILKSNTIKKSIKNTIKNNSIISAIIHIIWILLMSLVITLLVNEIFNGLKIGKIIGLIFISIYVVFSFAKKYQLEVSSKKTLEVIDIALTLLIGFFAIALYNGKSDSIGFAIKDMLYGENGKPPMALFYLGVLLLIVGIIKVFMIQRNRIKYAEPKL